MPPALQFLVLTFAGWGNRHQDDLIAYLREENRVLREHLGPRPLRRTDAQRRRLAVRGQQLGRRVLMQVAGIVTPDPILRWYRRLIAQTYDGSARRGRGRPMPRRDVAALVVRMAVEHPQWGYTRIRGVLSNLGHEIARTTVKRILHDHGIDPAPERSRRMPWKTFLQAHWEGLTACDRFTVEVLTLAGLQRYLVFFVIALQSRRVTIAGIHPQPYGTWREQMARNLTDPVEGCLRRARYLMHDRDPLLADVQNRSFLQAVLGPWCRVPGAGARVEQPCQLRGRTGPEVPTIELMELIARAPWREGRIWTPLSSVRTKPRFNPSYERRWFTFVASWLSAAGASTGQGSAQRSAGGGVALTRAERGGIRRLGFRSPSTLILRGGTASDCRRIFGPSREHARLRATMVNARGDANRWYGPVWPAPVVGVSPRRSDRCAIP